MTVNNKWRQYGVWRTKNMIAYLKQDHAVVFSVYHGDKYLFTVYSDLHIDRYFARGYQVKRESIKDELEYYVKLLETLELD